MPPVVTVAQLLELPTLSSSTVVAGASGLERPVWNVGIVAGTEVTEWVKPGAMLLSTGHPLSERDAALPEIVSALAARAVSCLAVRLGNYEFVFGKKLLAAADEVGLPIIRLTDNYAFDDILIDVLSRINLALRSEADFVERVHTATTEVVMSGGSLEALMSNMAQLLSARVKVFDPTGEVLAAAGDTDEPTPSWDSLEATAREVGGVREPTHNVVLRLGSLRSPLGFLECDRRSAAFGPTELRAAEKSATVVALALAQRSAVRAVETNYQGEVLTRVLRGELADPQEISRRLADIGWKIKGPLVVGLVRLTTRDTARAGEGTSWLRAFAVPIARTALAERQASGIAAVVGSDLVLIASSVNAAKLESVYQRIASVFARRARTELTAQIGIGISSEVAHLGALHRGYQQAEVAVKAGHYRALDACLTRFDDLGVLGLVLAASTDQSLASLRPDELSALDFLPARERVELVTTLRVVMENNLNLAVSARLLHCHYNTLRRRVKRLEEMLGPFTSDADTRLAISLMLRLRDFREGYRPPELPNDLAD